MEQPEKVAEKVALAKEEAEDVGHGCGGRRRESVCVSFFLGESVCV